MDKRHLNIHTMWKFSSKENSYVRAGNQTRNQLINRQRHQWVKGTGNATLLKANIIFNNNKSNFCKMNGIQNMSQHKNLSCMLKIYRKVVWSGVSLPVHNKTSNCHKIVQQTFEICRKLAKFKLTRKMNGIQNMSHHKNMSYKLKLYRKIVWSGVSLPVHNKSSNHHKIVQQTCEICRKLAKFKLTRKILRCA